MGVSLELRFGADGEDGSFTAKEAKGAKVAKVAKSKAWKEAEGRKGQSKKWCSQTRSQRECFFGAGPGRAPRSVKQVLFEKKNLNLMEKIQAYQSHRLIVFSLFHLLFLFQPFASFACFAPFAVNDIASHEPKLCQISFNPQLAPLPEFLANNMVAAHAARAATGFAWAAAVKNQSVRQVAPFALKLSKAGHNNFLRLRYRRLPRHKTQSLAKAMDVRIDNKAHVGLKAVAKHHVSSFAGHPTQSQKLIHRPRHLASELLDNVAHGLTYGFGLAAKQTDGSDVRLNLLRCGHRIIGRSWVRGKQRGRAFVHAHIRRLGRANRGHQQLVRVGMIQFAVRVWIMLRQQVSQSARTLTFLR